MWNYVFRHCWIPEVVYELHRLKWWLKTLYMILSRWPKSWISSIIVSVPKYDLIGNSPTCWVQASSKLLVSHSKYSLLDVWEVSIFTTVLNCRQLMTTIFCFYSHANRKSAHSSRAASKRICVRLLLVFLGLFWVIQLPQKRSNSPPGWFGFFNKLCLHFEVTWTPVRHLR